MGLCMQKTGKMPSDLRCIAYNRPLDIRKISEYIANNITRLEDAAMKAPQEVLCELRDLNITGLGTVYLITLLYFISRGNTQSMTGSRGWQFRQFVEIKSRRSRSGDRTAMEEFPCI